MGLSNLSKVFDPIRGSWVAATPEERVRQQWIQRMIGSLGFPKGFLVVEKQLKELPHLQGASVPDRRLDLLVLSSLYPLLLIECKAGPLSEDGMDQLIGYNHYVKAPFLALVNEREVKFAYPDGRGSFLPTFQELTAWLKR